VRACRVDDVPRQYAALRGVNTVQAVVLAGGLGTRLRSRVTDLPKPMAPIAGRPFLEYLLDRLDSAGCDRVALATGHLSEAIESHFGHRYRALEIGYSRERTPLGTGGAIVQALRTLPRVPTLVLNGDSLLEVDLAAFWAWCDADPGADAVVVRAQPDVSRYGAVTLASDRVLTFGEKGASGPGFVNAGIYRLRLATFDMFSTPSAFSIELDFLQPHARELGLRAYVSEGRFIDIGVPEDYDRAQTELPLWARST